MQKSAVLHFPYAESRRAQRAQDASNKKEKGKNFCPAQVLDARLSGAREKVVDSSLNRFLARIPAWCVAITRLNELDNKGMTFLITLLEKSRCRFYKNSVSLHALKWNYYAIYASYEKMTLSLVMANYPSAAARNVWPEKRCVKRYRLVHVYIYDVVLYILL